MTAIFGVDVSAWQGEAINWSAARRAGVVACYVKLTQDGGGVNPDAHSQVEGARAAGIDTGGYCFSQPSLWGPEQSFTAFSAVAATLPLNLPPMVDDETVGNLSWTALKAWMEHWLTLAGAGALHYSDRWYLTNLGPLGRQWTARPGAPGLVAPDFATQVGSGPLPGFPGSVDQDWFDSSLLPQPDPPPTSQESDMLTFDLAASGIRFVPGPDQLTNWNAVAASDQATTIQVIAYDLAGKVLGASGVLTLSGNQPKVQGPAQKYGSAESCGATGPCTLGFVCGPGGPATVSVHGL